MNDDLLMLLATLLIFALGLIIGYLIGAARVHRPLIESFRTYYRQWAEARIAQHTRFLISYSNLCGAIAINQGCAAAGARNSGGLGRSRITSLRAERARMRLESNTKGGSTKKRA